MVYLYLRVQKIIILKEDNLFLILQKIYLNFNKKVKKTKNQLKIKKKWKLKNKNYQQLLKKYQHYKIVNLSINVI